MTAQSQITPVWMRIMANDSVLSCEPQPLMEPFQKLFGRIPLWSLTGTSSNDIIENDSINT